jgi:hypothetical protein
MDPSGIVPAAAAPTETRHEPAEAAGCTLTYGIGAREKAAGLQARLKQPALLGTPQGTPARTPGPAVQAARLTGHTIYARKPAVCRGGPGQPGQASGPAVTGPAAPGGGKPTASRR